MLSIQEFFENINLLLDNENITLITVFIPNEFRTKENLAEVNEEKMILEYWSAFLQSFPFSCRCTRNSWGSYLILLEEDIHNIVTALKAVFNVWESLKYPNLWRIGFTNLKYNNKERKQVLLNDFECTVAKGSHYHPCEKLIEIQIEEKIATVYFHSLEEASVSLNSFQMKLFSLRN